MLGSGWPREMKDLSFRSGLVCARNLQVVLPGQRVPLVRWAPWRQQSCRMLDGYCSTVLATLCPACRVCLILLNQSRGGRQMDRNSFSLLVAKQRMLIEILLGKEEEVRVVWFHAGNDHGDTMATRQLRHGALQLLKMRVWRKCLLCASTVTRKRACWSGLKTKHLLMKAGGNAQLYPKEKEGR